MKSASRNGVTLIEVLVAIFVMAIGLLALLTLFPLGALSMAQAIRDNRTGETAAGATAIINGKNLRFDPEILQIRDPFNNPIPFDPYTCPPAPPPPLPPTIWPGSRPLDPNGPSFPVLVDPNGFMSLLQVSAHWAPANFPGVLCRRNVSFGGGAKFNRYSWFNSLDDITFQRSIAFPDQMGSPA